MMGACSTSRLFLDVVAVFAVGVVLVVGEVKLAILLLCETADVSSDVEL